MAEDGSGDHGDKKLHHQNGSDGTAVASKAEPSEDDPCIKDAGTDRENFRKRTEQMLRDRSGLSRRGLYIAGAVVLVAFLLLITVIALAAAWPRIPHHQRFPVCQEAACLRASAQVREAMNSLANPCTDLWGWACGGWLSKYSKPGDRSVWNQRHQLQALEAVRLRDLINTLPPALSSKSVEGKMKSLYQACLDQENFGMDNVLPLQKIITKLGGWQILRDWNVHDWAPRETLKKLHEKHFVTPFFQVSVEPDPGTPGSNIIRISPSGLGLPDRLLYYAPHDNPIIAAYKQLISDVVLLMKATKSDASKFAEDIFYYERRIAEITPNTIELQNPVNTYNPRRLKELQDTAKSLPLQDILEAMFPKADINEMTEVLVSSPDYLMRVSEIVSSTDKSLLNNYVIWTLVRSYLPYLPSDYTKAYLEYRMDVFGIVEPPERWQMCIETVQTFMGVAAETKLEGQFEISVLTKSVIKEMFNWIKSAAQKHLEKYSIEKDLFKHLSNKIDNLQLQVGLPSPVSSEEFLSDYYSQMFVQKGDLFESVGYGNDFKLSEQTKRYKNPQIYDELIPLAIAQPPKVSYSPSQNTVVVPRALLTEPMFESTYPRAIIYGRLGVEIAEAIVSSVLPYQSFWTGDLKLLSAFHLTVNQSERAARYPARCIASYVIRNQFATEDVALNTSMNALKHISALSLAREALMKSLESTEHIHQPALETLEDSALFYLSYAQTKCSKGTEQQKLLDNTIGFTLSEKSILYTAWGQDPEFSSSVQCSHNENQQCGDIF